MKVKIIEITFIRKYEVYGGSRYRIVYENLDEAPVPIPNFEGTISCRQQRSAETGWDNTHSKEQIERFISEAIVIAEQERIAKSRTNEDIIKPLIGKEYEIDV